MQKKVWALLLAVVCLMTMTVGTVSAAPQEVFEYSITVDENGDIVPYANSISCGLTNASGSNYYAWASGSSAGSITVSVYLYKGSSQINQASKSGTSSATAKTSTMTLSSGTYTVRGYITSGSGTDSASRNYNI